MRDIVDTPVPHEEVRGGYKGGARAVRRRRCLTVRGQSGACWKFTAFLGRTLTISQDCVGLWQI